MASKGTTSNKKVTDERIEYLIAKALCMAAGSEEIELGDADEMLDILIERYPSLAQKFLHEFNSDKPAPHLRVVGRA